MADKINKKALAITGAITCGAYLGIAALLAMQKIETVWFSNESFMILTGLYPGLSPTPLGILAGIVWGVICGGIIGTIIAALYNWADKKWK